VMYGMNIHLQGFVRCTYAMFLATEHPVPAMEVNEHCGLFCYMQGFMLSSEPCPPVKKSLLSKIQQELYFNL
jgi:hypothetical protein